MEEKLCEGSLEWPCETPVFSIGVGAGKAGLILGRELRNESKNCLGKVEW